MSTSATPAPHRSHLAPLLLLLTLVLLAVLGAGAIALERPVGQVRGQVLTMVGGKPLAGAKVTFSGPVTRSLMTDDKGVYRFFNLPVGKYYVSAKAKRYDVQWQDQEIEVVEGQTTEGVNFQLARTRPTVSVSNTQRVFTPDEAVRLYLRGTQVPRFEVKLYRVDLDKVLPAGRNGVEWLRTGELKTLQARGALSPVKTWSAEIRPDNLGDDDWFFKTVQMPDKLDVGAYLATFAGEAEQGPEETGAPEHMEKAYWFNVTRLALVTKRADTQLLTYGVDLISKKPVAGVSLMLLGESAVLARAGTDARGLARLDGSYRSGELLVAGRREGSWAIAYAYHGSEGIRTRLYAYTDRPVYRPGQRAYFKGLVRREQEARYQPLVGSSVRAVIKDPNGTQLMERSFVVGAASAFDGAIDLPAEAALGEYAVELTAQDGSYQQISFKVADYRKPEFKVDIATSKPRYTYGQTAQVHMDASYYFGAPVSGAKLLVTVYSAPMYWDADPDADFYAGYTAEPGLEPYWGFGDVVQTTEATTDAQGNYDLKVDLPKAEPDSDGWVGNRIYTVSVEAMDAAQRPVKSRQSFQVTQGDFRLHVDTDRSVYAANQPLRVDAKAETYDGKPVATPVTVKVLQLTYEARKTDEGDEYTDTKRKEVYTGTLTTDANGLGALQVPQLEAGAYEIVASAKDARGNVIRDLAWTWIASEGEQAGDSMRYGALQVILDKKVYHPGDTARALIVSPVPGLSALVTVEGTRLHDARVITMAGTSTLVELPVMAAYKPNAFVAAAVVNGKELMSAERSLNVLPEDKFLQVAITTDKSRYEPGETARYTIETRDHTGKPIAADVSLGIVDQAIYAIEPEQTPDIRAFFHGPRWNTVSTGHSFPEEYSGGLDKNAPDPRVRARFEDTAAWFPNLRTGADGRISVEVTLPDNLTTWVATARADTLATQVGSARHNVVATKDLLVRLETPRFVVDGDRVVISAIAHNYTETDQPVSVTLTVAGLALDGEATQSATIAPGDAKRVAWNARVTGIGEAKATVVVKNAAGKGDAMALPFPAEPFGAPGYAAGAAEASTERPAELTLEMPGATVPGTSRLTVQLRTSPLPAILSAIDYLHQYPYGCVEQTMSRFLPDVAIPRRLSPLGAPIEDRFPDQATRIRDGIRRLVSMQQGNGAWGWWSHDEGNMAMTSYVLYGLAEARKAGYDVPQDTVKRGVEFLGRQLPQVKKDVYTRSTAKLDAGADTRAFMLFALAWWQAVPPAELDRLWADRAALSRFGLAQTTWVLAEQRDFRRLEALDLLTSRAKQTETQAFWASDALPYAWQDNSIETTAYALRAILAISPEAPIVPKVMRWLQAQNTRGWWESTKDSGAAAIALSEAMVARRQVPDAGYTARVRVNGNEIGSFSPDARNPWAAPAPITTGGEALKPGANQLSVTVEGPGSLDVAAHVAYVEKADRLPPTSSHGLHVDREYFLLPADVYARAKGKGTFSEFYNDKLVASLPRLGDRVKAGERVLVRLSVEAGEPLRYMALEDPLPAGCEILEDQPPNWGYWWDHQEYRDDRAAFFFSYLGKGKKTLYYVMRPTTQGSFRVLPPTAWAMYTPEVRARGSDRRLEITE